MYMDQHEAPAIFSIDVLATPCHSGFLQTMGTSLTSHYRKAASLAPCFVECTCGGCQTFQKSTAHQRRKISCEGPGIQKLRAGILQEMRHPTRGGDAFKGPLVLFKGRV